MIPKLVSLIQTANSFSQLSKTSIHHPTASTHAVDAIKENYILRIDYHEIKNGPGFMSLDHPYLCPEMYRDVLIYGILAHMASCKGIQVAES